MSKKTSINNTIERAFTNKRLGTSSLKLNNCFIKSATYEGMYDNDGVPNQKLITHHVELAKNGVGLTTVSYGAVSKEGKTFANQMHINAKSLKALKKLTEKVHDQGGKVSMQLTHCGYFSKNKKVKKLLAPSNLFNAYGFFSGLGFAKAMSQNDLDKVKKDFVRSALSLKSIGFDALEIHMGHGYLLSQFLSPLTNKRTDKYGGSINNRLRFPLELVQNVIDAVGPEFPVLIKLNLDDGLKGGFSIDDCTHASKQLEAIGCAALVLSGGFTSKSPFYLMRGEVPLKGMIDNASSWAEKITMMVFGPLIIKKYPFHPNFFLEKALMIRQAVKMDLVYLGGVDSREGIAQILNSGFNFIAMARPLIHDPEFLKKIKDGSIEKSLCNRCNECIVEMDRKGIKCTLRQ